MDIGDNALFNISPHLQDLATPLGTSHLQQDAGFFFFLAKGERCTINHTTEIGFQ